MKITQFHCFLVPPRWLFLKVETDEGISGWGEPIVEGKAATVLAAVSEMEKELVGKDPRQLEDLWQRLYRGGFYRGGPVLMSALAGIDQALWDIKGKALGVPVYELLGGAVRDRMQIYGWIGGDRPSDVARAAKDRLDQGFQAVKMNGSAELGWIDTPAKIDEVVNRVGEVRDTVGTKVGIGVDFHGRVHRGMAKVLARALDAFQLMFIEEPVLPENLDCLPEIARHTSTPIATGERLYSRWDYKRIFEQGCVDIIQPDLSHAGGISEVRRIAAMAEAYDVALAPHCPLGPIALASSLQVDFHCLNATIQETSLGIHYNEEADLLDYLKIPEALSFAGGFIPRLEGPGLGIDINEAKVEAMAKKGHAWKTPQWNLEDGSIAEW